MSKYKYLSEKRAWIWLIRDFREFHGGLCGSIEELEIRGKISSEMKERMLNKLRTEAKRLGKSIMYSYLWSLDDKGNAQREAFARSQAAQL